MNRRVVVTGLGLICPAGNDVASSWSALMEGRSCVRSLSQDKYPGMDISTLPVTFGGLVQDLDMGEILGPKSLKYDPFIQYGLVAADQAAADAGIGPDDGIDHDRCGSLLGSGIAGIQTIEKTSIFMRERGPSRISPFFIPGSISNMLAGIVSIRHDCRGPNFSISSACASGNHSLGEAARMIQRDDVDLMFAGASEIALSPLSLAGFGSMRALSRRNDDPEHASRPWDVDRDGFVMGDGVGVMVLEEYEHARRRGANIYCELSGYSATSDAHHITLPVPDGSQIRRCMNLALKDAEIDGSDLDYVNAHATSTPVGDVAESQAIESVLGADARSRPVSSTKSMVGHLLGAAGAVESIICALSIHKQQVPPTINLQKPDEGCNLDYVQGQGRDWPVKACLNNSFGFGGTNACIVFRALS